MTLTFGSLFSGIGGFDLGFERAGMECRWQCEIDKAASSVLSRHWPGVPNIGDVKNVTANSVEPVDLICGGFPCQDLSVAGKRAGLAGERSGLWFEFHRILAELRPQWVVIENVPGLLSSNGGRDFAVVLRGLVELGYGVCWRVLDAQYFGVAQRRRRVFIVGSLGDGRAAEILFERESGLGDTAPSREAGQGFAAVAGTLSANRGGTERPAGNANELDFCIPVGYTSTRFADYGEGIGTLRANGGDIGPGSETLIAYNIQHNDGGAHKRKDRPNGGLYVNETDTALTVGTTDMTCIAFSAGNSKDNYGIAASENVTPPIRAGNSGTNQVPTVAWDLQQITSKANRSQPKSEYAPTLNQAGQMMAGVRRLTPTECERLQAFPDGWTDEQTDSARYRQLGNAVCVNVAEWIGRRIMEIT